jgi:hypothetical protein
MTTSRVFTYLIHAAALAGLLLVAPAAPAAPAGAGAKAKQSAAMVRDHRKLVRDHRGVTRKHPGRRTICAGWAC